MDQTQKLYQSVVENARTGLDACEQLMSRTKDAGLRQDLMNQRRIYQDFAQQAEQKLYDAGAEPHAKNPLGRMGMWMGIQMNTLTDASASHIADMLIQGATMGVVGMTRDQNDLPEASAEAKGLAADFIARQQECIDGMKAYL